MRTNRPFTTRHNQRAFTYNDFTYLILDYGDYGFHCAVDAEDADWLAQINWTRNPSGYLTTAYSITMHGLLMKPPPGFVVDHINRNKLDNRKSNLRVVTQAQNCQNRTKTKRNTTGYKGVNYHKARGTYHANIGINGTAHHLGRYFDAVTASYVYDMASRAAHPCGCVNHPELSDVDIITLLTPETRTYALGRIGKLNAYLQANVNPGVNS